MQTAVYAGQRDEINQLKIQLKEVTETARQMRAAQRKYFAGRSRDDLIAAKVLERKLDEMLK